MKIGVKFIMKTRPFGQTQDGRNVDLILLECGRLRCTLCTLGATLVSLEVPDREGRLFDITLGYDTLEDYETQDKSIGATVGRHANRIGGAAFTLNGERYELSANLGEHQLHGGFSGFNRKVWTADEIPGGVRFVTSSAHLEEGFPGNLEASVSYVLTKDALELHYECFCDRDTVCNLTNHAYFNLNGKGSILGHMLRLHCSSFTPVSGTDSIPTGELLSVSGTPFDFREATAIGTRIDADNEQLRFGGGYDHNLVVDGEAGILRPAAEVYAPESGICMEIMTTSPGIQLYTGNTLGGGPLGKGGAVYNDRDALCLETQLFPDSPNKPHFPQPFLRAGDVWRHSTLHRFSSREI